MRVPDVIYERPSCILDTTDGKKSKVQKDAGFASYLAESPSLKLDKKPTACGLKKLKKNSYRCRFHLETDKIAER